MWKLSVIDDESNRTEVKLIRSDYTLGRAEGNTIRLTERNISRKHARLFRAEAGANAGVNGWTLEDSGSYTGCFVNGARIAGQRALAHGDAISLGDYRLELVDTHQEADLSAQRPSEPTESLPDRLVVMYGHSAGTVYRLEEDRLLAGRGDECQLLLDDVSVSRVHVEIVRTEHGLMILDKRSSNGLRINGVELPSAMLRAGDVVELGDVRLKFVPAGVDDKRVQPAIHGDPRALVAGGKLSPRGLLFVGLGVVVLAFVAWAVTSPQGSSRTPSAEPQVLPRAPLAGPEKALEEARVLLAQGAVVEAHLKLREIPAGSSLRQSRVVTQVEERWADEMFRTAESSPDATERRMLLDAIASSPDVDSVRRKRAADMSRELSKARAWKISDLPPETGAAQRTASVKSGDGTPASSAVSGSRRRGGSKSRREASARARSAGSDPAGQRPASTEGNNPSSAQPAKTEPAKSEPPDPEIVRKSPY